MRVTSLRVSVPGAIGAIAWLATLAAGAPGLRSADAPKTVSASNRDECAPGELVHHHNGTLEDVICYEYHGCYPPYWGAFGEGYDLGNGTIDCVAYWFAQIGWYHDTPVDCYIWDGGVTREPGIVLALVPDQTFDIPVGECGLQSVDLRLRVRDEFTVGYWANFSETECTFYVCTDLDGPLGHPWCNFWPEGWGYPGGFFGSPHSLGIGVWFHAGCTVTPEGTGDFPTIQAAVDASSDADTITLAYGTFRGPGNRDLDFHGKAITLVSASGNPDSSVIDCEGTTVYPHRGFLFHTAEGEGTILTGLTVTGGYADRGGAVLCQDGASPTIDHCIFRANQASTAAIEDGGGAICCTDSSSPRLERCSFLENTAGRGGAIKAFRGSRPHLLHSTLAANTASIGSGVHLAQGSSVDAQNTIIAFGSGAAVFGLIGDSAELTCCDVYGNGGGDWNGPIVGQEGIRGNISADPLFCGPRNPDAPYTLAGDSPCAPEHHPQCGLLGAWPVGCEPVSGADRSGGLKADAPQLEVDDAVSGPRIHLTYRIPPGERPVPIDLGVYSAGGRRLRTLWHGRAVPGTHHVSWNGTDETGRRAASGVYYFRLDLGGKTTATRAVLLR